MLIYQKNFAIFYKSQGAFYKKLLRNTFDTVANDHTVDIPMNELFCSIKVFI